LFVTYCIRRKKNVGPKNVFKQGNKHIHEVRKRSKSGRKLTRTEVSPGGWTRKKEERRTKSGRKSKRESKYSKSRAQKLREGGLFERNIRRGSGKGRDQRKEPIDGKPGQGQKVRTRNWTLTTRQSPTLCTSWLRGGEIGEWVEYWTSMAKKAERGQSKVNVRRGGKVEEKERPLWPIEFATVEKPRFLTRVKRGHPVVGGVGESFGERKGNRTGIIREMTREGRRIRSVEANSTAVPSKQTPTHKALTNLKFKGDRKT